MKKTILVFVFLAAQVLMFACSEKSEQLDANESIVNPNTASGKEENGKLPAIVFEETEYDFGKVIAGTIVKHTFKFKNIGEAPLIIESAQASCGCTVPKKPEKPIEKGESGEIYVEFNSEGRIGQQSKTVTIIANTQPNTLQLTIKGEVLSPDDNGPFRK